MTKFTPLTTEKLSVGTLVRVRKNVEDRSIGVTMSDYMVAFQEDIFRVKVVFQRADSSYISYQEGDVTIDFTYQLEYTSPEQRMMYNDNEDITYPVETFEFQNYMLERFNGSEECEYESVKKIADIVKSLEAL